MTKPTFRATAVLKRDLFGETFEGVLERPDGEQPVVVRRSRGVAWPVSLWLAAREARAMRALEGVDDVPRLACRGARTLARSFIAGRPLHRAPEVDAAWFSAARRLLTRLHRAGVTHNDTHKEANWIVTPDGRPALVDFQLATVFRRRSALFRMLAREDLRHLLKHKRKYRRDDLRDRERVILATPSAPSRLLRATVKRGYHLLTRRLLGWTDSEGWRRRGGNAPESTADSTRR
jgi:hypothetical protein